ncbi:hypothetical protein [Teichococcus aestuarii]|uniref:hypothetical protein n=1 Tax=Teichococcus aestuarii TaxID=568898 RepID=UPI003605AD6A
MSEEHGMLDLSACARKPELGERLRVVPNHVCPVSNLHDRIAFVRGGSSWGSRMSRRGGRPFESAARSAGRAPERAPPPVRRSQAGGCWRRRLRAAVRQHRRN